METQLADGSLRNADSANLRNVVRAAASGDSAAWDTLVERFSGMVWGIARRHGLSAGDAADVAQTTWLRLLENLDRIEFPERVAGWLATTARREALLVLRNNGRQVPVGDDVAIALPQLESDAPDRGLLIGERNRELWAAFERLPRRCQLILFLLNGDPPLSYEELSSALHMPIGSIGPTRGRCLECLRRLAASSGISAADSVSI
jgi:RNA polymerase sigma factor (sigma-70 family)